MPLQNFIPRKTSYIITLKCEEEKNIILKIATFFSVERMLYKRFFFWLGIMLCNGVLLQFYSVSQRKKKEINH